MPTFPNKLSLVHTVKAGLFNMSLENNNKAYLLSVHVLALLQFLKKNTLVPIEGTLFIIDFNPKLKLEIKYSNIYFPHLAVHTTERCGKRRRNLPKITFGSEYMGYVTYNPINISDVVKENNRILLKLFISDVYKNTILINIEYIKLLFLLLKKETGGQFDSTIETKTSRQKPDYIFPIYPNAMRESSPLDNEKLFSYIQGLK